MSNVARKLAGTIILATLTVVIAACISEPDTVDYPTLVGHFAEDDSMEPLIAEQAYISDSSFFVQFKQGEKKYYGGGDWVDQIDIVDAPDGAHITGPYLLPLGYTQAESWSNLPEQRSSVFLLTPEDWQAFREQLFATLLPHDERTGAVLHLGSDDYFLYYDSEDLFQARVIDAKPGDYTVTTDIAFFEFLQESLPMLESYLEELGITARRIAFSTGDTGAYSLPFLYVNLDLPLAVFVRQPPPAPTYRPGSSIKPIVQTAGHITSSHTAGIFSRPFSSVYKLLFVATDTFAESIRPAHLTQLNENPIPPVAQGPGMDLVAWEERLDTLTGRSPSRGTIEYLIDGEAFFTRLIDAITLAKSSIELRMYIFDNDDFAARIGELLRRRSNEGIEVRILLDGLGTIVSTIEQQESLPKGYAGPGSVREFLEADSAIEVRQSSNPWLTGDHVKTVIIDGKIAFTGGMNIAREYRYDWHDLMIELEGHVVDILQNEFDKAWAHAGFLGDYLYVFRLFGGKPTRSSDIGQPVRVLFTRTDDAEIFSSAKRGYPQYPEVYLC